MSSHEAAISTLVCLRRRLVARLIICGKSLVRVYSSTSFSSSFSEFVLVAKYELRYAFLVEAHSVIIQNSMKVVERRKG